MLGAAFATREVAWNVAGSALPVEAATATDALRIGGLADWNVRKQPIIAVDENGVNVEVPGQFATLANIKGKTVPLGVVGSSYHVYQNEECVDLLDAIVGESGANYVAAGPLRNNRSIFTVLRMPENITIGGEDAHEFYMVLQSSHDGGGALRIWVTGLRLACTNMLRQSQRDAKSSWSIRHTASMKGRVAQARESLELGWKWAESFQTEAERLLAEPFSDADWFEFLDQIAPESESEHEGWVARQQEKRDTLTRLWNDDVTNGYHGTRWGAYQAVTEYADWFQPTRGGDADLRRAERTLDGAATLNMKQNAFDLLSV